MYPLLSGDVKHSVEILTIGIEYLKYNMVVHVKSVKCINSRYGIVPISGSILVVTMATSYDLPFKFI